MRLRDPRIWIGVASLGAVLWLFVRDLERTSPGPLHPTHAREAELAGNAGCGRCHGGFVRSMRDACAACHEEIERQLVDGRGFHGTMEFAEASDCAACHAEHHGAELAPTTDKSFALAGVPVVAAYDHRALDFTLGGRHTELDCVACHEHAALEVLPAGTTRYLGLDASCASCHEDPHEGRMARACADCHGQEHPFSELAAFAHDARYPLEGAHARARCLDCHPAGGARSVESLGGADPPAGARTCQDCHESPHAPDFLGRVVAVLPGALAGASRSCAGCHDAAHDGWAVEETRMSAEAHAATGFPLAAPHDDVACADCHPAGSAAEPLAFERRYPGRSAEACELCHADPHGGQFARGPFARGGCLACHDRHGFRPPAFDLADHARTAFPLEASHGAVACGACHERPPAPPDAPRAFAGTPDACSACHADAHDGFFAAAPAAVASAAPGCERCHEPTTFDDVPAERFDHAKWTAFALDGAHERADCASCHAPAPEPDGTGRVFGRVADRYPAPVTACASCHADVHDGAFGGPELAARVGGRSGCARCHTTEAFGALHEERFDHGRWTGFVLDGAHDAAGCQACHRRSPRADERGRTLGRVAALFGEPSDACATCHADAHFGAFERPGLPRAVAGAEGCARCHSTARFDAVPAERFHHATWTAFALEGAHADAACEACHPRSERPDRNGRTLGRARGAACEACHADPHVGQFRERGRNDCARCHAAADFTALVFDHERDSRFPLDEQHADVACAKCHVPWPLPGGGEAVRYKPLGTECADCHGPDYGRGGRR